MIRTDRSVQAVLAVLVYFIIPAALLAQPARTRPFNAAGIDIGPTKVATHKFVGDQRTQDRGSFLKFGLDQTLPPVGPSGGQLGEEWIKAAVEIVQRLCDALERDDIPRSNVFVSVTSEVGKAANLKSLLFALESRVQLRPEQVKVANVETLTRAIATSESSDKDYVASVAIPPFPTIGNAIEIGWFDREQSRHCSIQTDTSRLVDQMRSQNDKTGYAEITTAYREQLVRSLRLAAEEKSLVMADKRKVRLVGDIVRAVATYTHPDRVKEEFVSLSLADLEEFELAVAAARGYPRLRIARLGDEDDSIAQEAAWLKSKLGDDESLVPAVRAAWLRVKDLSLSYEQLLVGCAQIRAVFDAFSLWGHRVEFDTMGELRVLQKKVAEISPKGYPTAPMSLAGAHHPVSYPPGYGPFYYYSAAGTLSNLAGPGWWSSVPGFTYQSYPSYPVWRDYGR